jgi:hypothetical protein
MDFSLAIGLSVIKFYFTYIAIGFPYKVFSFSHNGIWLPARNISIMTLSPGGESVARGRDEEEESLFEKIDIEQVRKLME